MDLDEIVDRLRTEFAEMPLDERMETLLARIKQAELQVRVCNGF